MFSDLLLPRRTAVRCRVCPPSKGCYLTNPYAGEVVHQRFKLLKPLGSGGHGSVWLARDLTVQHKALVAVKMQSCLSAPSDHHVVPFLRRGSTASHPGKHSVVIPLMAFQRADGKFGTVMPVMDGSLEEVQSLLSTREVVDVMRQLFAGLDWLHGCCGVVHGDIKPDNVMLKRTGSGFVVKFTDFSSSMYIGTGARALHHSQVLSADFIRAPELLLGRSASYPIDVWALGCVVAEIWNRGSRLFVDIHDLHDRWKKQEHYEQQLWLQGRIETVMARRGSSTKDRERRMKVVACVQGMLKFDPKKRYTARMLYRFSETLS